MITKCLYALDCLFIKIVNNNFSKVFEIINLSKAAEDNRAKKTQRAKEIRL
jgi:hypothetical protein